MIFKLQPSVHVAVNVALLAIIVYMGIEIKRLSKSPMPREWNSYSNAANDYLYQAISNRPVAGSPVAHAGGAFEGKTYTNSIAALNANYSLGFRLFEIDLNWTADGELAAIHGWGSLQYWKSGDGIPTALELASQPTEFPIMMLSELYAWLEEHSDAFIITDLKDRNLEGLARIRMERPNLIPQFIPQIYLTEEYEPVSSLGYKNVILTLYRCLPPRFDAQIEKFAGENRLFAVTMPADRCLHSELSRHLRALGIPVYAHTVNDLQDIEQLALSGVSGVYTDYLSQHDATLRSDILDKLTITSR